MGHSLGDLNLEDSLDTQGQVQDSPNMEEGLVGSNPSLLLRVTINPNLRVDIQDTSRRVTPQNTNFWLQIYNIDVFKSGFNTKKICVCIIELYH